jgi:RHS repeat-associated protein
MIKGTARLSILLCCVLSAAEELRAVSSHWVDAPCMANTAFAAFPAAMPEFKNEKQLATWRAEQASKADTRTAEETHAFYTGKPYVDSTGGYAFQYRSYNPELARWTSEDPSGFPDGANQNIYAPVPTRSIDSTGLDRMDITAHFSSHFPGNVKLNKLTWSGAFVWTFAHGKEKDGTFITPTPSTTGWSGGMNPCGVVLKIGGVDVGINVTDVANYTNNSTFNSMTDSNGVQWKQWEVDLEITFTSNFTVGGTVTPKVLCKKSLDLKGDWYE